MNLNESLESGHQLRPRIIGLAALYAALAAFVFFLAFYNLDGRLLWGDEAETATLARNVLKFGLPKVDDGLNHISLHGDKYDARDGIWTWSPWLQHYITAASFEVFGINTWAARAPFALIGWLAVMLLGAVAWKIYKSHRVTLAAMLLMGTSEIFLLHIRQCRYYSLTVLAEILVVYGIYQILAKNKYGAWWIFSALTIQFYCNYTIAAANVPILLVLAGALFRQERRSAWSIIICLGACFLTFAPWLIYTQAWHQSSVELHLPWTHMVRFYAAQFHFHFFPWCILLLPAWGWLSVHFFKRTNAPPSATPPARFETCLLLLPVLYAPVLLIMPGEHSRYLLPVLPVMCLLVAVWLFRYLQWTIVAGVILMLQCTTNIFAIATFPFDRDYTLRAPLNDFVYGINQPYQDRFTDLLKFLNAQAHPGDLILSPDPELSLVFYGHYRVLDSRLPPRATYPPPNWILPQSISGILDTKPGPLPDILKPYYDRIDLVVHDSVRYGDIPEPDFYQYQTTKTTALFIVYKLKDKTGNPTQTVPSSKP